MLFPIESTVVSLASQLFGAQDYSQVKLLTGFNLTQNVTGDCVINVLTPILSLLISLLRLPQWGFYCLSNIFIA